VSLPHRKEDTYVAAANLRVIFEVSTVVLAFRTGPDDELRRWLL
jgi:hypothetical protein